MDRRIILLPALLLLLAGTSCGGRNAAEQTTGPAAGAVLTIPPLAEAALVDRRLRVVATTSIIGDVVARVGGDAIALTILMAAGEDPHSYQPGARALTNVAEADVVFVNGWDLEEALVTDLANIGGDAVIVPISAGIIPLARGAGTHDEQEDEEEGADDNQEHGAVDPHVWLDISHVDQWVFNTTLVLSTLDPGSAPVYERNAAAYQNELTQLKTAVAALLDGLPQERRVLVTNHDSLGYFAAAYGFEVLGTVIPGSSTLAEPSARDLAQLVEAMEAEGVCALFTETTVSGALAGTVAAELDGCPAVEVVQLYTGALGPAGSGAETYVDMTLANVNAIVTALR